MDDGGAPQLVRGVSDFVGEGKQVGSCAGDGSRLRPTTQHDCRQASSSPRAERSSSAAVGSPSSEQDVGWVITCQRLVTGFAGTDLNSVRAHSASSDGTRLCAADVDRNSSCTRVCCPAVWCSTAYVHGAFQASPLETAPSRAVDIQPDRSYIYMCMDA
jgi:hypothetical protein